MMKAMGLRIESSYSAIWNENKQGSNGPVWLGTYPSSRWYKRVL